MSCNTVDITTEVNQLSLTRQEISGVPGSVIQSLEIIDSEVERTITETTQALSISSEAASTLELYPHNHELEVKAPGLTIYQSFSGEGAVADGATIVGTGTTGSPLAVAQSILDDIDGKLTITNRLSEFDDHISKEEAVTNLGLHIIDGGTF